MNREELNWLLETIQDAEAAERFVLAQYERGRISLPVMADVSERTTRRRTSYGQRTVDHLARHGAQVEVRRLSSGGEDARRLLLSQAAAFGASWLSWAPMATPA
jgi:hypothetical protein